MSSSEEDEAEAQPQPAAQTPCAGCRTLRRRCVPGCVFAPYFPAEGDDDDPSRFAAVHRVFGARNAARMLEDVAVPEERRRAAETLVEQARARVRDPVFGCVSYVAILQLLNEKARDQVDAVREEIVGEFGDEAAAEAVDVAEAEPAARVEAMEQAERALAHARAKDAELRAVRHAVDVEWRRQECLEEKHAAGDWNTDETVVKTENTAGAAAAAGEPSIEQTMLMPKVEDGTEVDSPEGNGRPRQQIAETEEPAPAARKPEMLTPTAAAADQHRHLAALHAGTEPGIPGHGRLHQKVLEDKQSSTAAAEAVREATVASGKAPVAAPPHHDDSAVTQLAGVGTSFLDEEQRAAAEVLAKNLDTMIQRFTAAQQYHQDLASARYASMGADVTPRLQQLPRLQMAEQDMMMPLLAAGASRYGSLAAQYDDDTETELGVTLVHGHQDVHQQTVQLQQMSEAQRVAAVAAGEIAGEQGIDMQHAAAEVAGQLAAGAPQRHHPVALAQYDQTELDITLGLGQQMMRAQQLAAAAKVVDGEQETIIHQVAAADLAGEQEMTLLLQAAAAAAQQDPVAEYSETELGTSLGQGHLCRQMLQEQLLSGAVGVVGVPNTMVEHHVAAYSDGEHGNGSGATAALRLQGLGESAPFLGEQGIAAAGADGDDGAWDPNGFIVSGAAAADVGPAA